MHRCEFIGSIDVSNQLGECILWHEQTQILWWTDILESKLYRYTPETNALRTFDLPDRLASFGFTDEPGLLVCAFAKGLALFSPESKDIEWLEQPPLESIGQRFNDGRVDRQGRFWSGTMIENDELNNDEGASLYCLEGRTCSKKLTGMTISNSLCWSPQGDTLYFADSPTHTISRYPFDKETATLGAPQVFAKCPPFEPDGSIIDSEGMLWNALWGGSKVQRFTVDGDVDQVLELDVTQPTCVCLGGPELDILYITTARVGLTDEQLSEQPSAGRVLMYQTPFKGIPENTFHT